MKLYKANSITCGEHKSGYAVICDNLKDWGIVIREEDDYKTFLSKHNIEDSDVVAIAQAEAVDWDKKYINISSMESEVFLQEEVKE